MARINLLLSTLPYEIEAYIRLKESNGNFELKKGYIDTGAEKSLFPLELLKYLEHKILDTGVEVGQAGIARQYFHAVEAEITLYFEDAQGNMSSVMRVRAWFADTEELIIGFQDILEHATLFVDFRQTRTAWIEF
jgi:hypothetical protein